MKGKKKKQESEEDEEESEEEDDEDEAEEDEEEEQDKMEIKQAQVATAKYLNTPIKDLGSKKGFLPPIHQFNGEKPGSSTSTQRPGLNDTRPGSRAAHDFNRPNQMQFV